MKNPNRYGSITKLSGNRRKPFWVREGVTGQQKTIGYAETKEKALMMLAEYNHCPWTVEARGATLKELFDAYVARGGLSKSVTNSLKFSIQFFEKFWATQYKDLNPRELEIMINDSEYSPSRKSAFRNIFNHLDGYALELDMGVKPLASRIKVKDNGDYEHKIRKIFTEEDIERLWSERSELGDCILFLIYTGFRIQEALNLNAECYNMEGGYFRGGLKTKAGKHRIVPVHHRLMPIVEKMLKREHLFDYEGSQMTYNAFYRRIEKLFGHNPHECRHTFRSRLDSAGGNQVAIDRLMGHASASVGEAVYTHKTIEELRATIELVK